MTGKVRRYVKTPSPNNSTAAVFGLEDRNGFPVDISTSQTGGLQEFINLCFASGSDGESNGGPCDGSYPNGVDPAINFLAAPVDIPPMQKGHIFIGAETLQAAHSGAYVVRADSRMAGYVEFAGGQIVTNQGAPNQIGWWEQPRTKDPQDGNSPDVTSSYLKLPSIVCAVGIGQICALLDTTYAPLLGAEFQFIEPNGGDYGVVVLNTATAGHNFASNRLTVTNAHRQKYSCVDLGHGSGGNIFGNRIDLLLNPGPGCTGFDYWGNGDTIDLTVWSWGGQALRGLTLEAPSTGAQIRMGYNNAATPIIQAPGAGHPAPNYINGIAYTN